MSSSKFVISVTVIACILIVGISVFYKVVAINHEKLYTVSNKLIIEAAQNCYYDKKCENKTITLNDLYEKEYLKEEVIDPVTKEVYNNNSYVEITSEGSTFNKM